MGVIETPMSQKVCKNLRMEKVKFRESLVQRQSSPEKYGFTAGKKSVMEYGGKWQTKLEAPWRRTGGDLK